MWGTGIGDTSVYNVACLSGTTLHLRLSILTASGKNKIVRALEDGVPPATAIPGKRVEISLESIRELRHSEEAGVLEIHFGARSPAVVRAPEAPVHREIYEALRGRIAPGVAPTAGTLEARNAIYAPAIGLFLTVIAGGVAIWKSTVLASHPNHDWLRDGPKNWLDKILIRIGTSNVVAIVLVVGACFAWCFIYRLSHPHPAEVIVPDRPSPASSGTASTPPAATRT